MLTLHQALKPYSATLWAIAIPANTIKIYLFFVRSTPANAHFGSIELPPAAIDSPTSFPFVSFFVLARSA
jgi:hypothetical protein